MPRVARALGREGERLDQLLLRRLRKPRDEVSRADARAPAANWTDAPSFHARLMARKALFWAGSTASAGPVPVMLPAGGTMAAAESVRVEADAGHAVERGRVLTGRRRCTASAAPSDSAPAPSSFIFARTSSASGVGSVADADAHLQRQRPAGRVVRAAAAGRRGTGAGRGTSGRRAPRAPSRRIPGRSARPTCRPDSVTPST